MAMTWFPTNRAIAFLSEELKLEASGKEQDWDVELADPHRIEQFLKYYLKNAKNLEQETRRALIALILSSFEDSFYSSSFNIFLWKQFENILIDDGFQYIEVIKPWLKKSADEFFISSYLRLVIDRIVD